MKPVPLMVTEAPIGVGVKEAIAVGLAALFLAASRLYLERC